MRSHSLVLVLVLVLALFIGCNSRAPDQAAQKPNEPRTSAPAPGATTLAPTVPPSAVPPNTVEIASLTFPADFKPAYIIIANERMDYLNVPRLSLRATIVEGLSREALRTNIEHALASAWQQQRASGVTLGAISVFGYRDGDDTSGSYTAAMGEFAPAGDWQKADPKVPLDQWKAKVEIPEGYFKKRETTPVAGTKIKLVGDDVVLSSDAGKWDDDHKVVAAPKGTAGKLMQSKTFPITADFTMYRFEVEVTLEGKTYRGWVHKSDLEPLP